MIIFTAVKYCCILHGHVFVMANAKFLFKTQFGHKVLSVDQLKNAGSIKKNRDLDVDKKIIFPDLQQSELISALSFSDVRSNT